MSIWDFAGLAQQSEVSGNVLFDEKIKRGKLMSLCETLTDCE